MTRHAIFALDRGTVLHRVIAMRLGLAGEAHVFRLLYQDLRSLQPARSGCDIVGALARPDRM